MVICYKSFGRKSNNIFDKMYMFFMFFIDKSEKKLHKDI